MAIFLPLIPLAGAAAAALGTSVLAWYFSLTPDDQVDADRRANELAYELFQKTIDQLTVEQMERIHAIVKRDYA